MFPPTVTRRYAHSVPQRLAVEAKLSPEQRRRGLFAAIVYGATVTFGGTFSIPDLTIPGFPDAEISGPRVSSWLGRAAFALQTTRRCAGTATSCRRATTRRPANGCGSMAFTSWSLTSAPSPGQTIALSTRMDLRGTDAFHIVPAARQVSLDLSAPWPTPSFSGTMLPTDSSVTDTGFTARWQDGSRQAVWFGNAPMTCSGSAEAVAKLKQQDGVDLLEAVPTYRMVNRTAKYVLLFLALSFLTYFLFETLSGIPIHPIQYGLIGLSFVYFRSCYWHSRSRWALQLPIRSRRRRS